VCACACVLFGVPRRVSVEDALAHPYLEQLHFPDDEPCGPKISKHEFDFERYPTKAGPAHAPRLRNSRSVFFFGLVRRVPPRARAPRADEVTWGFAGQR
jgi:hypothetical protein